MTSEDLLSAQRPETKRAIQLGASIWLLAVQFFIAQAVVQSAWTTPFSLSQNFISDLGNTTCAPYPLDSTSYVCSPWHAWMNASFIVLGLTILAGGALVRAAFPRGWAKVAGLAILALAGLGIIAVGIYPENETIALHRLGAVGHFVLGNLGLAVLGIALWQARDKRRLAVYSIVSGAVGLVATALFITDHYLGLGIGGMERVAAYPLPLWLMFTGFSIFRS
ncbi:MAG: DUF998 domain-containing protein [Acidobacteria bacterium]|nr:DUF998 domain-containing protein [Acidobacteriota bacterium]